MKKNFGLMLLCAVMVGFVSCEKEDDAANPLKGTLWSYDDEVTVWGEKELLTHYIEFVDNKSVKMWDTNGHGPYFGTYVVNGQNRVTFNNLYDSYWGYYIVNGVYTSRSMTIYIKYDSFGEVYTGDTYTKE